MCITYYFTALSRFYSGVVAGAREALFNSVPSISISLDWYLSFYFDQLMFFHSSYS